MPLRRRLILPAVLLAVGSVVLTGCIPIPAFNTPIEGTRNLSKDVGPADSNKPVRVGSATPDLARQVLGNPIAESADRRRVAYGWMVKNATLIFPLFLTAWDVLGSRTLVLTFGSDGVLKQYDYLTYTDPAFNFGKPSHAYHLPPDLDSAPGPATFPAQTDADASVDQPATRPSIP